ncbi:V-type ATP synthase subunit D [Methanofollis tationis]|uniref:V-type ATP synthase subunit D n=1 Tax=Methanofollis tationis TaxID=81417 RepID=A0A7K4HNM8_9EURY|nr:V-type ATP synthase subunit D [Methanofollis tationis]NVO66883.1 V-type ATP synthase subunit D [Methanofollis tationis]
MTRMEAQYRKAGEELTAALIMAGTAGVTLAAFSVEEHPSVIVEYQNFVGLALPQFRPVKVARSLDERGYGLVGTSSVIDDAADACEEMVDEIIKMAGVRMQVLLLMREIATLTRRVNALEKMLLPELRARERTIESMRDKREEFNRLFLIKKKKTVWTEVRICRFLQIPRAFGSIVKKISSGALTIYRSSKMFDIIPSLPHED